MSAPPNPSQPAGPAPADLAREAHDFAALGWHVFPLQPGQKKPYGFTTGLRAASADVEVVSGWWAGRRSLPLRPPKSPDERMPRAVVPQPRSNIGLRTGAPSGVWTFDIDGAAGIASLLALTEAHGRLPPTVRMHTGGGGGQLFFQWPGVLPWGAEIRNSASKAALGAHLDVRGEGGYTILPPSLHPSGNLYRWAEGCAPWECEVARAPWWLLRLVAPPPAPAPTHTHERPKDRAGGAMGGGLGYAKGALANACEEIARAAPGTHNVTFHRNAYGIGRLVAAGALDREAAKRALIDAGMRMAGAKTAYGDQYAAKMVDHAFRRAEANPRQLPSGDGGRGGA
ncbi:bifunctional DNA primase/polymerase [Phenylobacterium sp. SCN 70-31]|uniref:bifunctional DNA primase/polymerase n=1 Tax=Phenylobacterium sp. SCN 70-31 TaxID=1660129 RepID=UPI00086B8E3A|nr:bifunctional DNA primase/polymerase [Phenylobacterium sp. SCN 70-31]ODT88127.1 MAG: hypothetical protein ABS78_09555 [Phenylobacterium sp. SCN 70-31]